ncbi:MAG: ParB/RepB/Spo0J family partition protein [Hyphomicrobium sp.]
MNRLQIDIDLIERGPERRGLPVAHPSDEDVRRAQDFALLNTIVVRPIAESSPERFALITGESAWLAAQAAGMRRVPATVREDFDDAEIRELAAEDTLGALRADPIEQAITLKRLCDEQGLSVAAAGRRTGRTRTATSHLLRLLKLAPEVQELLRSGTLSAGHARALVSLNDSAQVQLAQRAIRENASVRTVEEWAHGIEERRVPERASSTELSETADPHIRHLESDVSEVVGCPVRIALTPRSTAAGVVQIHFDSLEVLDGILERLGYGPERF